MKAVDKGEEKPAAGIADIAQDIASIVAGFKTIKQDYYSGVL